MAASTLPRLLREIRACELCKQHLPLGPRPVLSVHASARVLIIGQAPGRRVHASGIPWSDPSGDRLREWLQVEREQFYDPKQFAIVPMGFCYPGTGKSGDLPPRPECAATWHDPLLEHFSRVKLVLLLSQYAHQRYLADRNLASVTETVRAWKSFAPRYLPLPHPSPRNNQWLRKNPWFEKTVLPDLRRRVRAALAANRSRR